MRRDKTFRRMTAWLRRASLLLGMLLALAACAPAPTPTPTLSPTPSATPPPTAAPTPAPNTAPIAVAGSTTAQAFIRIVHAAPGVGSIDVLIEQLALATSLTHTRYSQAAPLGAGLYTVRVVPAGAPDDAIPIASAALDIEGGQLVTLILIEDNDEARLFVVPENLDPLAADESRITLVNAAPGVEALMLTRDDGRLIDAVAYGAASDAVTTLSGSAALALVADGSPLALPARLRERTAYTLLLVGTPDAPVPVVYETPVPGRTRVRVINAGSDVGAVAVYLDERPLLAELAPNSATETISITAGSYTLNLYPANADPTAEPALASARVNADPDTTLAYIVVGTRDRLSIVTYEEDTTPTPPGQARVAFMNANPAVPLARAGGFGGGTVPLPDLGFGQTPATTLLDAGAQGVEWLGIENGTTTGAVALVTDLRLEAGVSYLYLLTAPTGNAEVAEPLIFSQPVGTAEAAVVIDSSRVRFVNALATQSNAAFSLGDALRVSVPFASGSQWQDAPTGEVRLVMQGTNNEQVEQLVTLEANRLYSVYGYALAGGYALLVVDERDWSFDATSGRIRLVNVSATDEALLGLASVEALAPALRVPTPEGAVEDDAQRLTLPRGSQRYINDLAGGILSNTVLIPVGSYDIYILDMLDFGIARTLIDVTIAERRLYDVVAFASAATPRIDGFLLTVEPPLP